MALSLRVFLAYPKGVTYQMVFNFLSGGTAVNVFARYVGAKVFVVDAGVDYEFGDSPYLIKSKIGCGTKDFSIGTAISMEETRMYYRLWQENCPSGNRCRGRFADSGRYGKMCVCVTCAPNFA